MPRMRTSLEVGDFTLIWEGPAGLFQDTTRNSWGKVVNFMNATPYKSYRFLVATTAGGAGSDGVQYSEVKIFGQF